MKNFVANLRLPVILSSLILIPFILLEWINRRTFQEAFPFSLFGILWLLPVVFSLILIPFIQKVRVGENTRLKPIALLLSVLLLLLIAWVWINILRDQMPCFLGVPNCD
jgi:hypothetical protein